MAVKLLDLLWRMFVLALIVAGIEVAILICADVIFAVNLSASSWVRYAITSTGIDVIIMFVLLGCMAVVDIYSTIALKSGVESGVGDDNGISSGANSVISNHH
ncbi:hypothetical protein [Photobacterium damselae]|uniref:hypothetical protein n=1 Tax=Photobacterium damselae TaxID=38293 RepID=UPI0040687849